MGIATRGLENPSTGGTCYILTIVTWEEYNITFSVSTCFVVLSTCSSEAPNMFNLGQRYSIFDNAIADHGALYGFTLSASV
jgi:hypothetical protein